MHPKKALPWVLLLAVVAVAVVVLRGRSSVPEPGDAGFKPAPGSASAKPPPAPPLGDVEQRDFSIHIGHEECEGGAQRFNTLAGRPPTDPKALQLISLCLRYGNVAWYKCVLRAASSDEAVACNRRLLNPDGPLPP